MLECVVNISEGRRVDLLEALSRPAGAALLDVHSDARHNRSVLTLAGAKVEEAARQVAAAAVGLLDIRAHVGAHPRIGVVDVVPFVPLEGSTMADAVAARDGFADWAAATLGVPCFLYGPERPLPEVRRRAFVDLAPDRGPGRPHPTAGATAVGARGPLVAYNLWLAGTDEATARRLAAQMRGPAVRALALRLDSDIQLSFNLIWPSEVGPADVYDRAALEVTVARAELVGLIPRSVLAAIPRPRWAQLDLEESRTIEARLGSPGG